MRYCTAVPIGRGGTAEVARAWDPGLERWVALKFLLQTGDPELEARMLREARAQARIDHPNVCPVYEVGRRDGRPFIAMQYIEGQTLDRAAWGLVLEQKVALLRTVAEAVHAAHAAGLIHRDLKPGNILVEEDEDGAPVPYVVDFGIARETELPGATASGLVVGTPGYLSPEQARGETLDRRSDVHALGVLLYELLAGRRPHQGRSAADELAGLLSGEPPPLRRVAPHVPRDLETVVMTCLEHDPDRRYPSARALADDLGRFLDGRPVAANPAGRIRRLWRRARRHPAVAATLTAATAAALASVAILVIGAVKYTLDLERERDLALAAQMEAEAHRRAAAEVSELLVDVFQVADPAASRGETITAREILDRGAERLDEQLRDQPLTRARLLTVIGSVYEGLGLRDRAGERFEQALALRREHLGSDHPDVADVLHRLAGLRLMQRRFEEAAQLHQEELAILLPGSGPTSSGVARARVGLASSLRHVGRVDEASDLIRYALPVLIAHGGEDHPDVLNALNVRAGLTLASGDLEAAEAQYEDVLERTLRLSGADHPRVIAARNNLAYTLSRRQKPAEAERVYRDAWRSAVEVYGEDHPHTLMIMNNLAGALYKQGAERELEQLLRRQVEVLRHSETAERWRLGSALVSSLGTALMRRQAYAEAEPVVREGVAVLTEDLGADHTWVACARGVHAASLFGLGRRSEAAGEAAASLGILGARETLSRDSWVQVGRIVEFLEGAGAEPAAARFRKLLTEERRPPGA